MYVARVREAGDPVFSAGLRDEFGSIDQRVPGKAEIPHHSRTRIITFSGPEYDRLVKHDVTCSGFCMVRTRTSTVCEFLVRGTRYRGQRWRSGSLAMIGRFERRRTVRSSCQCGLTREGPARAMVRDRRA